MGIRNIYFRQGSGSFKLPVDYDSSGTLAVVCLGGGGGGARRANSGGGGGGGGGGALARGSFTGLRPGDVIFYSVGTGGSGGASAGANGSAGTVSWVNVSANVFPANSSVGVSAASGTGGFGGSAGTGGGANVSTGNLGTATGGNGGTGGNSNGSGGGGGGSSGNWNGATSYTTGFNGGNGFNTVGDGGGGGGGGVNGAGVSSTGIGGAAGGLNYDNASAPGGGNNANLGGGGGGSNGINSNNVTMQAGGFGGSGSFNGTTGVPASGWSGGGGGGGGGSNNSGTTGGRGGVGGFGAGGGGGGSGVAAGGNGGDGGSGLVFLSYTAKETMLPSTGALSFNDIQTYYGGTNPISITEYYGGGTLVPSLAQNASNVTIPSSGTIAMSNFRGSPFKLYREVTAQQGVLSFKNPAVSGFGFLQSVFPFGQINNTAFTLSGGAGVAITGIYWRWNITDSIYNFIFQATSSSIMSNSGWTSLILNETTVFNRASASFSSFDDGTGVFQTSWTWSTSSANPMLTGNTGTFTSETGPGQVNMVYFV